MYVYIYLCMYSYIRKVFCVYVYFCMFVSINVCMYVRTCACIRPIYSCICNVKRHSHPHSVNGTNCSLQSTRPFFCFSVNLYCATKILIVLLCCFVLLLLCCVVLLLSRCVALLCVVLRCVVFCCVVLFCVVFVVLCRIALLFALLCLPYTVQWTAPGSVCFFSAPDSELF
jgi:hypothetical protein